MESLLKAERREKRKKPKMRVSGRNIKRLVKTIMDASGKTVGWEITTKMSYEDAKKKFGHLPNFPKHD